MRFCLSPAAHERGSDGYASEAEARHYQECQQAILNAARQLRDAAYEFWEVPDPPRGATLGKAIAAFDRAIGGEGDGK